MDEAPSPQTLIPRKVLTECVKEQLKEKHAQSWPRFFYPIAFDKDTGEPNRDARLAVEWFVDEVVELLGRVEKIYDV